MPKAFACGVCILLAKSSPCWSCPCLVALNTTGWPWFLSCHLICCPSGHSAPANVLGRGGVHWQQQQTLLTLNLAENQAQVEKHGTAEEILVAGKGLWDHS